MPTFDVLESSSAPGTADHYAVAGKIFVSLRGFIEILLNCLSPLHVSRNPRNVTDYLHEVTVGEEVYSRQWGK